MVLPLVLTAVAAAAPIGDPIAEAAYAIQAGRLDQARAMIAKQIAGGARGPIIERLLADLAFASGKHAEAFSRYESLTVNGDAVLLERAAISAVKSGALDRAKPLADQAVAAPGASWRAWNVRGVAADLRNDFAVADESYRKALSATPDQPDVLNNLGWSHLLRGEWQQAAAALEKAVAAKGATQRARNNLELAKAAIASDLPRRAAGESDADFAARLNDAGVAAQIRGERQRAIAAFAQAIATRDSWYDRAARNLKRAESNQ
ncbi:tetratricopeptide repeat protein [Sphingomonas lutea]|uniref:Tetratricopeptide repeat protein n=1 Tax=Sphingomonas lutea TaxID=1045317 RepID=A0A7G9SJ84_9SPHN|nr:tetratricopeptide repeat protein [Sphingomonas lutea]QNN67909.1 tetratricopeptide repeat protein [Sphingomonas lutea]